MDSELDGHQTPSSCFMNHEGQSHQRVSRKYNCDCFSLSSSFDEGPDDIDDEEALDEPIENEVGMCSL